MLCHLLLLFLLFLFTLRPTAAVTVADILWTADKVSFDHHLCVVDATIYFCLNDFVHEQIKVWSCIIIQHGNLSSTHTTTMSKGPNANADFQNQYNAFKESLQQLSRKIGEIEGESEEHK